MADIKTHLGSLTLVQEDSGRQVIEWEIARGLNVDFGHLINLIQGQKSSDKNSEKDLSKYVEELFNNFKLPISCYQQATYFGLRSAKDNSTIIYWNENSKEGYCNISCKSFLIDPILSKFSFEKEDLGNNNESGDRHYLWTRFHGFCRAGAKEQLSQSIYKIMESYSDLAISKLLIEYNKHLLSRNEYGSLKISIDPDWWKEYNQLRKRRDEDYSNGAPTSFLYEEYDQIISMYEDESVGPFLQIEPLLDTLREKRLIIDADQDSRFSNTRRLRFYSKEEINDFFEQLAPQLENHFKLPD